MTAYERHPELSVVDDGMGCLIAKRCLVNPGRLALGDIFSAVDSDYYHIVGVLFFDLPQLRKDVQAVDSAVRPEIQKDYPATKAFHCKRVSTGVNPVEARRKFRRANAGQLRDWS
ncbi:MAG: hypothetical protein M3Z54_10970 [Gemmatimonadota bacterium]|nr:hypothetical protein [Gemmatimonadota bacterium]